MTQAIVQLPAGGLTPADYDTALAAAHLKAASLARIVDSQKLYTQIGAGKHLRVEGWLTLAEGYGYKADIEWARPLTDGGYEARAVVLDHQGQVVSHAEAECGSKGDDTWTGKPAFQQRSMAQTRAISKALASRLRWVVVLAGYAPTPAEEMVSGQAVHGEIVAATMGFCPVHKAPFEHRKGMGAKGPYDFWACPKKEGSAYCRKTPDDWLTQELATLGFKSRPDAAIFMGATNWQEFTKNNTYAQIVEHIRAEQSARGSARSGEPEPQEEA